MTSPVRKSDMDPKAVLDGFRKMRSGLETFLNLDIQEIRRIIQNVETQTFNMPHFDLIRYFTQKVENFLYRLLHEVDNFNDRVEYEMTKRREGGTERRAVGARDANGPKFNQELETKLSCLSNKVDSNADELNVLKANLARLEANVKEHMKGKARAPRSQNTVSKKEESKSKKDHSSSAQSSDLSMLRVLFKIEHKIDELLGSRKGSIRETLRPKVNPTNMVM